MRTGVFRYQLLALMAGIFAVGSEELVVSPLLAAIAGDLGTSIAGAGNSVAVYGLATALGALVFAPIGDRVDRRTCLLIASALFILGTILCATAPALPLLLVGRAAAGLATGVFVPAAYAFVGENVPYDQRARTMGIVVSAWSLSLVLGVPAGALIGGLFGWRSVFWTLAVIGAMVAALLAFQSTSRLPSAPLQDEEAGADADDAETAVTGANARVALLVALIGATFLNMLGFYGMYTYIGTALHDRFDADPWIVGAMILSYGIGFALVSVGGRWADRFDKTRLLLVLLGALTAVLIGLPVALPHPYVLAPAMFVWGVLQGFAVTLLSTVLSEMMPGRRAAIMAIYSLAVNIAVASGAFALGPVFENWGFFGLALCCAGVTLAGALALAVAELASGRAAAKQEPHDESQDQPCPDL